MVLCGLRRNERSFKDVIRILFPPCDFFYFCARLIYRLFYLSRFFPPRDALQLFKPEDLLKAKFELLSDTSMVDSTIDIYKEMNPGNEESAGNSRFYTSNLPECFLNL